jgi:type II secretory pathway component PulK
MGSEASAAVRKSEDGSALVAVVFTLLVVAALAGSMIKETRSDLELSINYERQIENELASEAGIAMAILALGYPSAGASLRVDGQPFDMAYGKKQLRVAIVSEAGKINLNHLPNPLLKRLLQSLCPAARETLWTAIEAKHAQTRGAVKPFLTVDEIGRLPGAYPGLVAALKPYLSVYSFREAPDFGLAPPLLKALLAEGGNATGLSAEQSQKSGPAVPQSGVFTISAFVANDAASAPLEAVVYLTGDKARPYRILDLRHAVAREEADCQR